MNSRGRPAPLPLPSSNLVYTVSQISKGIRTALENAFDVVIVQGEVSGFKGQHSNGNTYFSLKDPGAEISVVLFADRTTRLILDSLANGITVQVEGDLTVFERQGKYQLRALRIHSVGYGALQARFDALKRKLELEGLFAVERKRPLPLYPTSIGIVTSTTGAALQDLLRILRGHAPYARITLADTRVQGDGAARDIAAAIRRMNRWGQADVLIVGRGGGSTQDLWAFNEEIVVRAIVESRIPVVSAVGHEADITLADFAADHRAATPTHAAHLVVKDIEEIRRTLAQLSQVARKRILAELEHEKSRLRGLEHHRALREPAWRIRQEIQNVDLFHTRLTRGLRDGVTPRRGTLQELATRLRSHTPSRSFARARDRIEASRRSAFRAVTTALASRRERLLRERRLLESVDHVTVLRRGYALVWSQDGTKVRKRGTELHAGDSVELQFFDARAGARVTEVIPGGAVSEKSGKETS